MMWFELHGGRVSTRKLRRHFTWPSAVDTAEALSLYRLAWQLYFQGRIGSISNKMAVSTP